MYICVPHACLVPSKIRKEALDFLGLELQTVASSYGHWEWNQGQLRSSKCS